MDIRRGRSVEVDFFRGVVLIVIVLDHMPGSSLSHVMLHAYALCDSAEVFVFLGGYASAAAYTAVMTARGENAARLRFVRRCWEIYRAYLLTALLTLLSGGALALLHLNRPMVELTGWLPFAAEPLKQALNIAVLRRQPYLSSVLPMYMFYALLVPAIVPLALRSRVAALALSAAIWCLARPLAVLLSIDDVADWAFNPFAWQLMFVLGIVCRLAPISERFHAGDTARWFTRVAIAAVLAFAAVKLVVLTQPLPGTLKQNLSVDRVINFIVIAWLAARLVRMGSIARLAQRLPAVVTVGRTGLVCFVGGTLVSLIVDTATPHTFHGFRGVLMGLAGDFVAIGALLMLARAWHGWRGQQPRAAASGARCG
ncbi:OpgC domain-containing protein [bacterium M00.F.Ca.ET.228.01.1.1]|uniref:OpgC domain-containing protein n=1 Tax=Paraburkholderia phenoliruptrix TaxID=252970 RepID=UPI001091EC7E|nr:OpgC domain-containing protein [Paraburkholderia phenoliruptrix]TGP40165.1 OpgC domain-containing protein [bacterium M00.F.Ca.ET.228.01.1.1]TGR96140.1 OpgC domain-containing protein [bacterium M00.F.Ca.ET.191.01.1.1]TGT97277.1 OpgC domain-containing protein [bacterium M00.F.Ca.ET.155.01.1.1]MBW0451159.1 OpgC domain-containing protein [Paraburkholderia phenoliruptrix]MBW9101841.1 OpgC domain-containing protein [Paraburkholderia phenoliruptrix]